MAARRIVAAECSALLEAVDVKSERFMPYQRWGYELVEPNDSVITFNYDRVIERLDPKEQRFLVLRTDPSIFAAGFAGKIGVYKLHGSVDWRWNRDAKEIVPTEDDHFALRCPDDQLAIGSPGPLKLSLATQLEPLWKHAMEAVRQANHIAFVGYGFPQTDAYAKRMLIEAIRTNGSEMVDLHVVLGPELHSAPVVRMEGMLRHALSARAEQGNFIDPTAKFFQIKIHPLYAEDFFTVAQRTAISDPMP